MEIVFIRVIRYSQIAVSPLFAFAFPESTSLDRFVKLDSHRSVSAY